MSYGPVSQCSVCARFVSPWAAGDPSAGQTCEAFPQGIPGEVLDNTLDHRQPVDGDHGVRWLSDGRPYPGESAGEPVEAAAGHDITPGHDELHHWWTKGPGLARWAESPHPWTTLRDQLLEHVPLAAANRMASEWFHEVFGIWSGERKGDNPLGPG